MPKPPGAASDAASPRCGCRVGVALRSSPPSGSQSSPSEPPCCPLYRPTMLSQDDHTPYSIPGITAPSALPHNCTPQDDHTHIPPSEPPRRPLYSTTVLLRMTIPHIPSSEPPHRLLHPHGCTPQDDYTPYSVPGTTAPPALLSNCLPCGADSGPALRL